MTKSIHQHLQHLYPEDKVEAAYQALQELMDEFRAKFEAPPDRPLFSERDITLITYGDSIRQDGISPLSALNRFLKERVGNTVSAVHILPFFPYTSDDGFSVVDFEQVDPNVGTWDDVTAIAEHYEVMVDLVLNHMSSQNEWFKAFLAGNPDFDDIAITMPPDADLSSVTRPRVSPLLTPYQTANGDTVHVWTTFSADQVDLNFASPNTLLRILKVLLLYVEHGARIIRLDAVAYLWKQVGTTSIHLEETHRVIQLMRLVLNEVAPQTIVITETNVPHAENISYFGDGTNEAQMVYNFTLPPLLLYSMLTQNTQQLCNWINSLSTPSDKTTFFNFAASHDGIGVRPLEGILDNSALEMLTNKVEQRGGQVSYRNNSNGSRSAYELNITYVDAVTDPDLPMDLQVKQFVLSQAVAMALAGVPAIYIHSLLGSHNYQEGVEKLGYNRAINRAKLNLDDINVALDDPTSFRSQVFQKLSQLLKLRVQQSAFHPNAAQVAVDLQNDHVLGILREGIDREQRLLALHNFTPHAQTINIKETYFQNGYDLINHEAVPLHHIHLEPFVVRWITEAP